MKGNIKKILERYKSFLIAPICSILILLIIYAIKGIYPFGNMTIANGDIGQSYLPFYNFLYDIVYNGKSIFYDYTLGMGSNMYGGFIVDGLLNPSTFVILLSSRENIPYMLSYVLIIKIAFIALTSYILFNKLYKKNTYYNVIFSVLYALSGYVLMYNTNIMWLDVVGLFPLLILSMKYMFETNKIHWYIIVLALILIFNYNLAFMVLLFIVIIVPIYIKLGLPKEKRKKAVFNLMLATGLGGCLSAFAILPSFIQVMTSYRMSGTSGNTVENVNILLKLVVFLFYSLPVYGFIGWLRHYKEDKNNIKIYGLAFLLTAIIPIFCERVNLLWHTGSYQMFPYRYGFIPLLIMYLGALKYFNDFERKKDKQIDKFFLLKIIMCMIFANVVIIGIQNVKFLNGYLPAFLMPLKCFIVIGVSCVIMQFVIKIASDIQREKVKKVVIFIIVLTEIFMYSYAYIGVYPEIRHGREWSDEGIFTSYEIEQKFNIKDTLYRIKDLTASTTENCPLVHNIPAMSTFLHIISKEQVVNCFQLGYSHGGSKINDYGGTIFSDAVYGVKYILTKKDLSDKIYNYIDTMDEGVKLYEYKNTLPIGVIYENEVDYIPQDLIAFDAQNYLYKQLFNKEEDIIEKVNAKNIEVENNKYIIEIGAASELYIYSRTVVPIITVNGEDVIIPITNDSENTIYPSAYSNGILDLGTYENQTVEIELLGIDNNKAGNIQFGILDIEKYNQIFQENNQTINVAVEADKIKVTGYSDKDTKLFIPINYDSGWKVSSQSSQNTTIKRVYNNFIGLEIKEGNVDIELKFRPVYYNVGVIISLATIIIMIILPFIKDKLENSKILLDITLFLGAQIYVIFFIKVYIISIVETLIY